MGGRVRRTGIEERAKEETHALLKRGEAQRGKQKFDSRVREMRDQPGGLSD
jgi:hypothetical protein